MIMNKSTEVEKNDISIVSRSSKLQKKTSDVWEHFTKKDDKIVCNHCKEPNPTTYKSNTSSSNLKRHYLIMHKKDKDCEDQPKITKFTKSLQNQKEFTKDFCIFLIKKEGNLI